MSATIGFEVNHRGPLFVPGLPEAEVDRFLHDARQDVGDHAESVALHLLSTSLRHPTGHYESQVTAEPHGTTVVLSDSGVVYGPWLEGTGSRNRTTHFKGYATFRRTRDRVRTEVGSIVGRLLPRLVRRLGG